MGLEYRVGPRGRIKVGGEKLAPGTPLDPELVRTWHNLPAYISNGQIVVSTTSDDEEEQRRQEWLQQRNAAGRGQPQVADTVTEEPDDSESDEEFVCEECGFEAKNAAGLGSHTRSHQDDEDENDE